MQHVASPPRNNTGTDDELHIHHFSGPSDMNKFSTFAPSNERGIAEGQMPIRMHPQARVRIRKCAATGLLVRERIPAAPQGCTQSAGWCDYLESWQIRVAGRAPSTCLAMKAVWGELRECARRNGADLPSEVTPFIVQVFVRSMSDRGLALDTVRDRVAKVRRVFANAVDECLQTTNPAEQVFAPAGDSNLRPNRSLPLSRDELAAVLGSDVYNGRNHRYGNSGEASYWIPVMMLRTGMTAEEVAGLAVEDIVDDEKGGYCFRVVDHPTVDDDEVLGLNDAYVLLG